MVIAFVLSVGCYLRMDELPKRRGKEIGGIELVLNV